MLAYLISICMVASSGQQKPGEVIELSDSIRNKIDESADSIVIAASVKIDSIMQPKVLPLKAELIKDKRGVSFWKVKYWYYRVTKKDTTLLYHYIKPL